MLFSDYKKNVILAYRKKEAEGVLSPNLARSTPAKLKDECLIVFADRYLSKDDSTLRSFFGPKKDPNEYIQTIKKFETDKFRPLNAFLNSLLKNEKRDTEDRNIELLAWLINFEPRPYIFVGNPAEVVKSNQESETTNKTEEGKKESGSSTDINEGKETEKTSDTQKKWRSIARKAASPTIIALALATSGIYLSTDYWTRAYICDRGTGKKYHLSSKCVGLHCKNGIAQTTIAEAEKNGKTLCGFEHK